MDSRKILNHMVQLANKKYDISMNAYDIVKQKLTDYETLKKLTLAFYKSLNKEK